MRCPSSFSSPYLPRKELLRDVISFANARGGDILFGVREQRDTDGKPTGIPSAALGLAGINADAKIRRLDDVVTNGVAPRIGGVRIVAVEGSPMDLSWSLESRGAGLLLTC